MPSIKRNGVNISGSFEMEIMLKPFEVYIEDEFNKILDKNLTPDEKQRLLKVLDDIAKENESNTPALYFMKANTDQLEEISKRTDGL